MAEKELTYAIIAIIVLVILILGIPKLLSIERSGLSKDKWECKYLDFIPGLCTSAQQNQQLTPQQQAQIHAVNCQNTLDYIINLYQNCGKNSQVKCRCEFDYNFLKDTSLDLNIINLPGDKTKMQTCGNIVPAKEISGKFYVDNLQLQGSISAGKIHTLVPTNKVSLGYELRPGAPTNAWWSGIAYLFGARDEYYFYVNIDNHKETWRFSPPGNTNVLFAGNTNYGGKMGILVEGNKRGLYIPYNGNNEVVPICQ